MVFGLNPREERVFCLNRREERSDDLIELAEMVGDLNLREDLSDDLNDLAEMVGDLNVRENLLVDRNQREERLVDLDPIGEMFDDLDPIGEMFDDLHPIGEMETKNERANQRILLSVIPKVELETKNERANQRIRFCLNPIVERLVYLNSVGEMMEYSEIEMMEYSEIGMRFCLNPIGEMETKNERANQRILLSVIRKEELETKNERANQRIRFCLNPIVERETKNERANQRIRFCLNPRVERAILKADTWEEKMTVEKQEVYLSNRRSCHGTKLLKSSFCLTPFFLTCAGGTGNGSSQPEHQGHSEIYPSTLNVVSNCPSLGEYMQRSLAKCADVCGSYMQDGNCAYHCMRDSSKTKLVEFCAKPKPLFDFCPEYDSVDQTIQKDMATLCNSTFSRNYYNSSDIYFCDPNNCLQLHESSMRSGATTLTTLMNGTTEMNGGDSQESFLWLFVSLAAITFALIIIGYILFFVKRGIFAGRTRKMTKKRNQNGAKYAYTKKVITNYM